VLLLHFVIEISKIIKINNQTKVLKLSKSCS